MVNSSEHGLARVVHHKDYYLRGGDMTVMVENHLYRIHSHFFERESLFFRQKFQSAEGEERGSSDNNAYTLDDVKSEDFSRFLWVFYNPKYSLYEAPLETWLSILHLANRWGFGNVKELTVRELEKMDIDPIEKIAIYHEYTINKLFLLSSYIAVCKREKPLTFAEGMRLGMETVLRIADARERARQRAAESGIRTPTFHDFEDDEMESMVREVFGIASRPTSPPISPAPPQTPHTFSYSNGTTHTGNAKVNGSTGHKANGSTSGRTNGTSTTDSTTRSSGRTNGTSIPEAARSSVDTMRSFATAMEPSSSSASSTNVPSSNAESKPAAQVPENKPPPPEKTSATSPDQTNGGSATTPADASKGSPWNKPNGTGEPSSVEGTKGSKDSSQALHSSTTNVTPTVETVVSTPVVVKSNDESEHKDQETDAEKDETKDPELNSVLSDAEGSTRGGRGGNRGKGQGQGQQRSGRGGSGKSKRS